MSKGFWLKAKTKEEKINIQIDLLKKQVESLIKVIELTNKAVEKVIEGIQKKW